MKFRGAILLFLSVGIMFQTACEKSPVNPVPLPEPASKNIMPPQPVVEDTAYVSAALGGFLLSSTDNEVIGSGLSKWFKINGTVQWNCIAKPDQAPAPQIAFPNLTSTEVSQLKKGQYVFEVIYRTDAGSKRALSHVFVVDDGISNGSMILPPQTWKQENWSFFPGDDYWIQQIDIANRPDLFCFRQGKKLRVELFDSLNNTWKEATDEADIAVTGLSANPSFYNFQYKTMTIRYDQNYKPDSVMDRLVKQPATIKLSY